MKKENVTAIIANLDRAIKVIEATPGRPYGVYLKQHYYVGTFNAPADGWLLRPGNGEVLAFASEEEAQQFADACGDRPCHRLDYGQYAPIEYLVLPVEQEEAALMDLTTALCLFGFTA